jgi:hypothetical protein
MNRSWIGLAFVALVAALIGFKFFFGANPHGQALESRQIATRGLAEALVARHPGKHAIILSNPFVQRPETDRRIVAMEDAGIRGLRSALEKKLIIDAVVYPELRPEAQENPRAVPIGQTTTPLSYLVATDALDRAAAEHPAAEILISLIGLPIELDKCDVWKKEGPPSFALLLPDLRMVGGAPEVAAAFKSGKLTAIVLARPNVANEDEKAGADFKAEFERRYILVTADNVDEVLRQSPQILQSP